MTTFSPFGATVEAVHDGDTLTVLADLGFNVYYHVDVRLNGCNAPELHAVGGAAARDWLAHKLPVGQQVKLTSHGADKYGGRWDCDLTLPDGTDVVEAGIAAGVLVRWDGKGAKPVPAVSA